MKSVRALNEFLVNGQFKYDAKSSPLENYQYFQQTLSFSRGVEFIPSDNVAGRSFLYLYDLPGLSPDLKKAKKELKLFYDQLLNQVNDIINQENDAFKIYSAVYDLFKEVQEDLNNPAPISFLAIEKVMHNPQALAEIRKKDIPLIRGTRKGAFMNNYHIGFTPIAYEDLGSEIKEFIISVYQNQNRYKRKLHKELSSIIELLFNKKKYLKHYRYDGAVADIVEVAVLLYDKVYVYGKKHLTLEHFTKDLAGLLGVQISRINDQHSTLVKRRASQQLMIKANFKVLTDYIDNINK